MESILDKSIETVQNSSISYCKYLSANDTKATKAHQSGYLLGVAALPVFLEGNAPSSLTKKELKIKWQCDFETDAIFTYYTSKSELRLTGFGRNFPFREESNVGDLFILCRTSNRFYHAFILSHDDEIEDFLAAFNISSNGTNNIINKKYEQNDEGKLRSCFLDFLSTLQIDFPATSILASHARNCYNKSYGLTQNKIKENPDQSILNWLDAEFTLFKTLENDRYSKRIQTPFTTVEELVDTANTILNRRKSRAGKSLEHHLSEIFKTFQLPHTAQAVTEDNKKPDFIFPSAQAYHDPSFSDRKLNFLASKTTCKDRWRQVLNEADRIHTKHLFTLQQGISKNQLEEMYKYNVRLVVPKPYLVNFPKDYQDKIMTLDLFIKHVQIT